MGVNTENGYFYLPGLGASGQAEKDLYDAGQQVADTQIEANKNALTAKIEDITGEKFADLSDIPAHPGVAQKILETTLAGYQYVDKASGTGSDITHWIIPQDYATGSGSPTDPWADDCIGKAIAAASAGDTIYMRAGYYLLSGQTIITKHNLTFRGAGINKTFVIPSALDDGFFIDGKDYITFQDFTVDGSLQTSFKHNFDLNKTEYVTVRNVESKNSGGSGINYYEGSHGTFENLLLHDNYEHGIHPGFYSETNKHNIYRNLDCYNNNYFGFSDRGCGQSSPLVPLYSSWNIYDGIRAWGNGSQGIQIAYQKSIFVTNCKAYDNRSAGFKLTALQDAVITNCIAEANGNLNNSNYEGIIIEGQSSSHSSYLVKNVHLVNVISKNHKSTSYGGITIRDADYVTLTDCHAYDDQATATQKWGLRIGALAGDVTNVSINNCSFWGNTNWQIYRSYDEVLVVDGVLNGHEVVAGDIQYFNGTNWVRLAKGTAGQVLTMNSGATAPEWKTL